MGFAENEVPLSCPRARRDEDEWPYCDESQRRYRVREMGIAAENPCVMGGTALTWRRCVSCSSWLIGQSVYEALESVVF